MSCCHQTPHPARHCHLSIVNCQQQKKKKKSENVLKTLSTRHDGVMLICSNMLVNMNCTALQLNNTNTGQVI